MRSISRADQLRRWIEARKRILTATRDSQVAGLCLAWIARDEAELDSLDTFQRDHATPVAPGKIAGPGE